MAKDKTKDPILRIAKRDYMPFYQALLIRLVAVLLSLVVCAGVIYLIVKMNPIDVYKTMFDGAFGNEGKSWKTIRDIMMLLCVSIALAPAFKMKFWNIGAEGQMLIGALATAACMIYFKDFPTPLLFLIMVATSVIAGAIWGLFPAVFKANFNTNETLFTLMMNYIAIQLVSYCLPMWASAKGSNKVGYINYDSEAGWLPYLFGKEFLLIVIIVLILTVVMFIYLRNSKQGYEISVVGDSENTARYAGINVKKVVIRTMIISGALCGLAGFLAVSGVSRTISTSTAGGRGFTAIIVAWLAKFNTFVMIAISALIVFLQMGAKAIASKYGLNEYVSDMITGIILFFILGSEFFIRYRLIFRKKHNSRKE